MLIPSTDIAVGLRRAKEKPQRSRIPFGPSCWAVVFAVGVGSWLAWEWVK